MRRGANSRHPLHGTTTKRPSITAIPNDLRGASFMADRKVVFVAFAIEDVSIRDLIKGQSLNTKSPFEYVDMSVKEAYDEEWKKKVRTRILRSDGVLVIVS